MPVRDVWLRPFSLKALIIRRVDDDDDDVNVGDDEDMI